MVFGVGHCKEGMSDLQFSVSSFAARGVQNLDLEGASLESGARRMSFYPGFFYP